MVVVIVNQLQCCIRQNKCQCKAEDQWLLLAIVIVCLLISYNVAFAKIYVMATINVRRRTNVGELGHVRPHTIKKLGPIAKGPKSKITHTPDKMTHKEHGTKVCKQYKRERNDDGNPLGKAKKPESKAPNNQKNEQTTLPIY